MNTRKNKVFPIILTVLIIGIIVYLFTHIKQPYIECSKETTFDKNIKVEEELKTTLDSNKISTLTVEKKIILPDELSSEKRLNSMKSALKGAYKYLGKDVKIETKGNSVIATITLDKNQTVILNDITAIYNDDVELEIISNTKSNDVISLTVKDKYTEANLITRLRNYGYSCK
ncbi:MAG: hypothetical protein IKG58_03135 [Bacilli bacterium]|nr:hypothetical protein [Bacilli bacterium]